MTALLHRLLHDRPHTRRIQLPATRIRISPALSPRTAAESSRNAAQSPRTAALPPSNTALSPWNTVLAAVGERLATGNELDALRSMHPRRIAAGR